MGEVSVRAIAGGEEAEAACVLGHAFVTNPNCVAILRGQGERERLKLEAMFRIVRFHNSRARVLVARDGGRIVGVLNTIDWPHCQTSGGESLRLLPRLVLVLGSALVRALIVQSMWAKHDPRKPHWHLGPVGVLPEAQGMGVGTAMLREFCQLVDERGEEAYLETEKPENVRLYERFGFSTVARDEALRVNNWFMWRPRRANRPSRSSH